MVAGTFSGSRASGRQRFSFPIGPCPLFWDGMTEHVHRLHSKHLGNERSIWVRLPFDGREAECLAVFLDAEFYRDGIGAPQIVDDLQRSGQIPPTLAVFVSHESRESRWVECPCHSPFAAFVDEELMPWLETRHAPATRLRQRALIGLSYTGLAAAFVALQAPLRFTRVVAQSGSFWSDRCALVERYRSLTGRLPVEFYLDVGRHETRENVKHREDVVQEISQIEGVRRFRDVLLEKGHFPRYEEFDGGHDFVAWKGTLPMALSWALV